VAVDGSRPVNNVITRFTSTAKGYFIPSAFECIHYEVKRRNMTACFDCVGGYIDGQRSVCFEGSFEGDLDLIAFTLSRSQICEI
jgi:hypothetical protein